MIASWAPHFALALSFAAPQTPDAPNRESIVVPVKVTAASASQPVVALSTGIRAGVTTGDMLFLLTLDGRVVTGELIAVGESESGARVDTPVAAVEISNAVVVRTGVLASLCRLLPVDAGIAGHVARLVPGRTTAWIDLGRRSGLQAGDHVLVRRATRLDGRDTSIPIARGQVLQLGQSDALISLQPLVGNAVAETGDDVELWPAPGLARMGRVNSAVLDVRSDPEGDQLTVVGSSADGFTEGGLLDVHRGSRFIGVASVSESGPRPLSRARMIKSASLETAREADTVILRAPAGPPAAPLLAPVFRIEGNYVLVAAGDVDGVQKDEKLRVQRQNPETHAFTPAWEITIEKVNIDFSGGFARQLDATAAPLRAWELAERQQPPWPRWRAAGIVAKIDHRARVVTADIDPRSGARPGDVVEFSPEGAQRPSAGVVLWRLPDAVLSVIPEGWGELETLGNAQLLVADASGWGGAPATQAGP